MPDTPIGYHRHPNGGGLVADTAYVSETAYIYGDARISGNALIYGNASIYGNALISGNASISGDASIYGNALISGNALIYGDARISGNASIYGDARISGDASIYGVDASIRTTRDVLTIGPIGSENGTLTVVFDRPELWLSRGCWSGSLAEFAEAVNARHPAGTAHGDEYRAVIAMLAVMAEHRVSKTQQDPD